MRELKIKIWDVSVGSDKDPDYALPARVGVILTRFGYTWDEVFDNQHDPSIYSYFDKVDEVAVGARLGDEFFIKDLGNSYVVRQPT